MLSVTEAAAVTGRSADLIRRWLRAGRAEGIRTPSGGWLVTMEAIDLIRQIEKRARQRPSI